MSASLVRSPLRPPETLYRTRSNNTTHFPNLYRGERTNASLVPATATHGNHRLIADYPRPGYMYSSLKSSPTRL